TVHTGHRGRLAARVRRRAAPRRPPGGGPGAAPPRPGGPRRPAAAARRRRRAPTGEADRTLRRRAVRRLPRREGPRRRGDGHAVPPAARGGDRLMRPLRLDLAGFTVFREPTTV